MNKSTKRFSMIESIVVLAVVMSVASMVFSAIQSSKDVAIKATCMSNISQIRNHTELYRKDFNNLPYSSTWLTDFTWAQSYISEGSLEVFTCPGDADAAELTQYSQLQFNTSYYYVPSRIQLEKNIADGLAQGVTSEQIPDINASQDAVIYDKSPDHHNGSINIAYLFKSDDPDFDSDNEAGTISSLNDGNTSDDTLLAVLDDGTVEIADLAPDPGPVSFDIVASAGEGGAISPDGTTSVQEGGGQTYTITPDDGSSNSSGKSNNGHGNNADGVDSSNPGNSKQGEDSDSSVDDEIKNNGNGNGNGNSSSSPTYRIADVLVDGESVGPVSSYTFSNVDDDHTISATFEQIPEFTVTVTSSEGGTTSPGEETALLEGEDLTITFTPEDGFEIESIIVNGEALEDVEELTEYNLSDVTEDSTIEVTYTETDQCNGQESGVYLSGSTLFIIGTDEYDDISISKDGNKWKVDAIMDKDGSSDEFKDMKFNKNKVETIYICLGGGDDYCQLGENTAKIFVYGGEGDDYIEGSTTDDFIDGGPGNDDIQGGDGDDIIIGGDGNDSIQGGSGNNTITQ